MNSIFDFDVLLQHHRGQLLAEAESERLARLASPVPQPFSLRTRVARALYALADRLAPETSPMLDTRAPA